MRTHLIATTRSWHEPMVSRLAERTGDRFVLVNQRDQLDLEALRELNPRYIFLPHWSYIIPEPVFESFECVIFHMTDLPFGRGGSPLQNLIARGIYDTKISAIRCVRELDAGPVYLKRDLSLHGSAEEIFLRASGVIEEMIVEMLRADITPQPQRGEVTTFKRRKPADGDLQPLETLDDVFDYIRMLDASGYPAAFLEVGKFRLEFSRASREFGRVVADVTITEKA